MGKIGEKLKIDFVVSTGDNFYNMTLRFYNLSLIFTNPRACKPTVLGNHDYRGDAEAQFSPFLRQIDSRWFCLRSFIVNAELAEIICVDTTPLVKSYFLNSDNHTYDWRGIIPRKRYITNLLKDVECALRESTAKWKIVVGHHAIRSFGFHGNTEELVNYLLPILKANNVDFYINGHDHCLQHISDTDSRIEFLTSGAGS
ncbi:purple acid phosphatase 17-like [Gossypium australe]|uniref:Purple acid phosphatase 17-like n=1 Tax=Gossypium australe TaxID=47621 RepID=A0A5B6UQJ8_9ROSI|nr:purple acid phosphatase 17-like [Gossypium australe]